MKNNLAQNDVPPRSVIDIRFSEGLCAQIKQEVYCTLKGRFNTLSGYSRKRGRGHAR
jgi:hypothetical protein